MLLQSTTTKGKVACWVVGSLAASYFCGSTVGMATIIALLVVCVGYITGLQRVETVEPVKSGKERPSCKTRVDKGKKIPAQQWRK